MKIFLLGIPFLIFQAILPLFVNFPIALLYGFLLLLILPLSEGGFYPALLLVLVADIFSGFIFGVLTISFLIMFIFVNFISNIFNLEYSNPVTMFLKSGFIFLIYLAIQATVIGLVSSNLPFVWIYAPQDYYKIIFVLTVEFGLIFISLLALKHNEKRVLR